MSNPKRQYDAVIPGIAGAIANINQHFNKLIDEAAKPKGIPRHVIGEVQFQVVREVNGTKYDVPIEAQIVSTNDGEAWISEDIGPFRNGESITLTFEEWLEADARYHGESQWDEED